ncbi:gamma-glutamyl-gamma-aminobutyrate hydrolase family protein [Chloroflexi bacterium TSY]|nr:gamma-glutamyl-gamma-aminobutyrate hydrolase family protein [Chloroflexi bacterium TSY]
MTKTYLHTPLIGLTTYHRDERGYIQLPGQYADGVRRAGGIPLLIQPGEPRLDELMNTLDGLILSGGGDVDPKRYTENDHTNDVYWVDQERDTSEFELTQRALDREMPLFCICRGFQVLNVALGGTLIPHIPNAYPNAIDHRQPPDKPYGPIPHAVQIDDNSRLTQILGSGCVTTASWHHQAIDKVAPGLTVVGRASDGIIEAVELSDHPQVLAVQWHPELTAAEDESQQKLFDALVELAQKRKLRASI